MFYGKVFVFLPIKFPITGYKNVTRQSKRNEPVSRRRGSQVGYGTADKRKVPSFAPTGQGNAMF